MTRWQLFRSNLWLHVRRAPRDIRSLKYVWYLLYLVLYGTYLIWTVFQYGLGMAVAIAVLLALSFGIALLIARTHAKTNESLLNLSPARQRISLPEPDPLQLTAVQNLLVKRATFADRASAEAMLRNGVLPKQAAGLTRRRTIDLARSAGIWDGFDGQEREKLTSPEGAWAEEDVNTLSLWAEDVLVLRWVLGMDQILTPLEFAELTFLPTFEISARGVEVGGRLLPPYDLRPVRDMAHHTFVRGLSECVSRGLTEIESAEDRTILLDFAAASKGPEDMLTGSKTFAEASDERVLSLTRLALRRYSVLLEVLTILDGNAITCVQES